VPEDLRHDSDLRARVAALLSQHANRVTSAAARLFPTLGSPVEPAGSAGSAGRQLLARPLSDLLAYAVRGEHLDTHGELRTAAHRQLTLLGGTVDQLSTCVYIVAQSSIEELAGDSDLGTAADDWPATAQLVRRAAFDVLGSLLREPREPRDGDLVDGQTGLLVRAVFELALAKELDRAARLDRPLTMLLIALDHGETWSPGLSAGTINRLIERLGLVVHGFFRQCDWLGHHAGDRIAVLLPDTEGKKALALAERLRESIEDRLAVIDPATAARVPVTASLALVTVESAGRLDPDRVTSIAEAALERAHSDGGNRIECASASTPIDPRCYPSRSS
jgi:diguanylate cyclase (GGDEF)-like protein